MNAKEAFGKLRETLQAIYEPAESANIADWVVEAVTGRRQLDLRHTEDSSMSAAQELLLQKYTGELLQHRPVQYVLGESYFYDMKLHVDERVLIPRPETEELVHWALSFLRAYGQPAPLVADLGTGSGCVALALKKHCPAAGVSAVDLSAGALSVAQANAAALGLDVAWLQADILHPQGLEELPVQDLVISNPPYITLPEQKDIQPHVLAFEPHQALFVTDGDPLQFYKAIGRIALAKLRPGGGLFLELHRDFAAQTRDWYVAGGWHTELRKDMQGEDRMLFCRR